jgi:hypothetical protein
MAKKTKEWKSNTPKWMMIQDSLNKEGEVARTKSLLYRQRSCKCRNIDRMVRWSLALDFVDSIISADGIYKIQALVLLELFGEAKAWDKFIKESSLESSKPYKSKKVVSQEERDRGKEVREKKNCKTIAREYTIFLNNLQKFMDDSSKQTAPMQFVLLEKVNDSSLSDTDVHIIRGNVGIDLMDLCHEEHHPDLINSMVDNIQERTEDLLADFVVQDLSDQDTSAGLLHFLDYTADPVIAGFYEDLDDDDEEEDDDDDGDDDNDDGLSKKDNYNYPNGVRD